MTTQNNDNTILDIDGAAFTATGRLFVLDLKGATHARRTLKLSGVWRSWSTPPISPALLERPRKGYWIASAQPYAS